MISVSLGGVLAKLGQQEASSLTIAFFRLLWAGVLLFPFYAIRRSDGPPGRTPTLFTWFFLAGGALALHFAFWIGSLRFTSVAVSVLLVNTAPILVAILSYLLFAERLTRRGLLGIVLAFGGSSTLLASDLQNLGDWRGGALALAGAVMLAIYLVAGRRIRQERSLLAYVYPTYVLAALILAALVLAEGESPLKLSRTTHLYLFLLGVFPQCIGHTSYNWGLGYLPATLVSTLVLAEPVLATFLAYWILGEAIGLEAVAGGAAVLAGIALVTGRGVQKASSGTRAGSAGARI